MSFIQKAKMYFTKNAETTEEHVDAALQTNYYRTTKDKALTFLESYFNNSQTYKISSISEEHGEVNILKVRGKKAFIVATVFMERPFYTAIDFSVSIESLMPFSFGQCKKMIVELNNQVSNELELIGK